MVTTLAYLEVIFILVNAAWFIFRQRTAATLSPEQARALAMELRGRQ